MAIKKCDCPHEYQDKKYGDGNRVHIDNRSGGHVCTVCAKVKK